MNRKRAIIIGGGPAGLTAAYELLTRTDIQPIVLEASDMLGGISRTVNYKGNRIDIGGHRFFSKDDRVMQWWANMLPMEGGHSGQLSLAYQGQQREIDGSSTGPNPETTDEVMLVRPRKSRIYYLRKFFDYPISLSQTTIANLGLWRMLKIGFSYLRSRLQPIKPEQSLEDFLINRFGRELYLTFFKSYTEKVWGVPCHEISAAWGAQRIKGLSITKAILNAIQKPFRKSGDVRQKNVETSLVEQFLYPKLGPGQMWETCAAKVQQMGGEIRKNSLVSRVFTEGDTIVALEVTDPQTGAVERIEGDYFFSTMPMQELVRALDADAPSNVREVSEGLIYRDFITVGLLLDDLKIHEQTREGKKLLSDNWIYIQEPDVKVGRLQIFNNWSPYMVANPKHAWIGLEYFCYESDDLWKQSDEKMVAQGIEELERINIIERSKVLDSTVIRVPKTYPAYFGSYDRFDELKQWISKFDNLFLVGRNGMHRYNNQDHSMLTAMVAVDNIIAGRTDKSNIWDVNTEMEYHEKKGDQPASGGESLSDRSPGEVAKPNAGKRSAPEMAEEPSRSTAADQEVIRA
ncbi:UDP-galactopyranose mutase [Pirellula staleyi DSM 6068]|uniref:UDP-galactopyranose mutase n=1 Tax=Pirellula staleyi (strain ATCC 27377 / DSM 6068 / ICPB 4128) TaxID=530564 RepID=D2QYQ5_PIRSD|nr:NAD(P)/FAD-dependent oxidoreductase [Pirellula staleyi]ADB18214.1 UDP-galactopyranose mutase [Pirellula staleyi DSM 6068]